MVKVFDNDIVKAFTGGESVNAIYTNGVKVWPMELPYFYYSWTPYISKGYFYTDGISHNYSNYSSNYFSWVGSGFLSGSGYSVETIETNADIIGGFKLNNNLTTVLATSCTQIRANAFGGCQKLTTISFPVCKSIGMEAFADGRLHKVFFPQCETIGWSAFVRNRIVEASFPMCEKIGQFAFQSCGVLQTISFPICKTIGYGAFQFCGGLSDVVLPMCESIGGQAFGDGTNLFQLTLGWSSVVHIESNTFGNVNYIYVPASLVDSYKVATNWSEYSSRIFPIP